MEGKNFNQKTMNFKYTKLLGYCLACSVFLLMLSCGSEKKESTDNASEFEQAETEIRDQIEKVLIQLPPPSELPFLLEATGADYDGSLVNDVTSVDKYKSTNNKAAMNLGIYAADVGYLSSYSKVQDALTYLNTAKTLADEVGVANSFDLELLERFESNLSSNDSLGAILNEVVANSDKHLQDNNRKKTAALMLTGSFIEGLYLTTSLVQNYPKDILPEDSRNLILVPVIRLILDQEKPLADLITLLKSVDQDEDISSMITRLEGLHGKYQKLSVNESIQNNRGDLLVTDATVVDITQQVAEIRGYITS